MKLSSLSDENSTHQDQAQNQTVIKYITTTNSSKNTEEPKPQEKSVEMPTQNVPALPQNSSPLVR
jgi:hypothetical protein